VQAYVELGNEEVSEITITVRKMLILC